MLQIRNQNKLKLVAVFTALAVLIHGPSFGFAATKTEIEAEKNQKQIQLNQLNQQIAQYNAEIKEKRAQKATLNNEIGLYDMEIRSTEIQIQATQTNMDNTELQIQETKLQIQEKSDQIVRQKVLLSELIVTLNEYDLTSTLQVGLGSDNFSDFMDQIQYTETIQEKVSSLLQQIKELKTKLEQDQRELEEHLEKLEQLEAQLEVTQQNLNNQKSAKVLLLEQTKGQEARYQKLLTQTKNEQAEIFKEINDLEAKLRGDKSFKALKPIHGILAWPLDGVLTQKYGNTGFTSLGYDFHNGLDIAAPAGASIYAAADGVVEATGTGQAAYGNWVVLRHTIKSANGHEILTLYAHMTSFKVKKGQSVKRGDLIGYEGNTGNTSRLLYGPDRGYHLHFTVFDSVGFGINKGANQSKYGPYQVPYGYTYNPMNFL